MGCLIFSSPLDFYQQRSFSQKNLFIEPSYYKQLCWVPGCRPCASGGPCARCGSRSRSCSCWRLRRRRWARPRRCTRSAAVCRSPPGPPCPWSWPLQFLHFTSVYFRIQYSEKAATVAFSVVNMFDISTVLTSPLSGPHPECIPWWSSPWWLGCTLWRTLHFSACSENMFSPPTHRRLQL